MGWSRGKGALLSLPFLSFPLVSSSPLLLWATALALAISLPLWWCSSFSPASSVKRCFYSFLQKLNWWNGLTPLRYHDNQKILSFRHTAHCVIGIVFDLEHFHLVQL